MIHLGSRRALVLGISEYDHLNPLPGAAVDANNCSLALEALGFKVQCFKGRVCMHDFVAGVNALITELGQLKGSDPLVVVTVACHAFQSGTQEYPSILFSDTPITSQGGEMFGFDVREGLVHRLNGVRPLEGGSLQAVLVFDCCRQSVADCCWRTAQFLPSLRNDFYMLFACDPGRRVRDTSQGGAVTQEFAALLPYAHPITTILEEVARRAAQKGFPFSQRPWVHHRVGDNIPVLGVLLEPMPTALAWPGSAGLQRDDVVPELTPEPIARVGPLELGQYIVVSESGLSCRSAVGTKTGSVARGHRFEVLELKTGAELGPAFEGFGPRRIWGRAGVRRSEWLALTDDSGCVESGRMNVKRLKS